jgi:hypothetical protein
LGHAHFLPYPYISTRLHGVTPQKAVIFLDSTHLDRIDTVISSIKMMMMMMTTTVTDEMKRQRKQPWPILKYYPRDYLESQRKITTTKKLSEDNQFPD